MRGLKALMLGTALCVASPGLAQELAAPQLTQPVPGNVEAENNPAPRETLSPVAATLQEIQDTADSPRLVVVPTGSFAMGSPVNEWGRDGFEGPQHEVHVRSFALGRTDITFAQWDACLDGGGCNGYRPDDNGFGRGDQPVINVSWRDAESYIGWLSSHTGKTYRLPSEAEWEYAARAGASTAFWWGAAADHEHANYGTDQCCAGAALGADRWTGTAPVGSFSANPFGLFDMNGNVMQFVEDCWHPNYYGAPTDGRDWNDDPRCGMRPVRGGAWNSTPAFIRSADRIWVLPSMRTNMMGFRVARDL